MKTCDVLVAGGGVAGIAAALSAARNGAKVILAEKQCALGGLATLGQVVIYLPLCDGRGHQVIKGMGEELLLLSIQQGGGDPVPAPWQNHGSLEERAKQRYQVQFNPWMFAILAEQLLLKEGVEILYDTHLTGCTVENGKIHSVAVDNKEGHWEIFPKACVDATGDADLCRFSGENTQVFRENRFAAWHYVAGRQGVQLRPHATPLYQPLAPGERVYDGTLTEDITQMIIRGHREILENVLREREKKGDDTVVPVSIPLVPSFRMTVRLKGVVELDETETMEVFPDCVGMTGDWRKPGPVFQIPLRCLYGKNIRNLLAAGRCISATTPMWDVTRVIPPCAVTGQAAGAAAALCAQQEQDVAQLDVALLQSRLREQGVYMENDPAVFA